MISVALCTYNGEKFIEEQLQSIFTQTILPDEIIISDDGSTDNTVLILENILKYSTIPYKFIKNNKPLKTVKNFSQAIYNCSGEWIFLCDQDDIWDKNKIEVMMSHLDNKTLMLFTNAELFNESGELMGVTLWEKVGFNTKEKKRWNNSYFAFKDLFNIKNYVTGATSVINRKLLLKAYPLNVPNYYYHDGWFAMHAAAGRGLRWIEYCTLKYRIHPSQQVGISPNNNLDSIIDDENVSFETFQRHELKKYRQFWIIYKIDVLIKVLRKKLLGT